MIKCGTEMSMTKNEKLVPSTTNLSADAVLIRNIRYTFNHTKVDLNTSDREDT
jgi:hypothetical protein